jgi:excisionase family DNA binding protein
MTTRDILTTAEAAEYLAVPVRQLVQWRYLGRGPTYVKLVRSVRYRRADLDAWLEAHAVTPQGAA